MAEISDMNEQAAPLTTPQPGPGKDTAGERPADNVLAQIHILSNRITRAFYSQVAARYGVSLAEWRVMLTLVDFPYSTAIEITNRWGMEKMSVSRAIHRLTGLGWITRDPNPDDRRSYRLRLTDEGRAIYNQIAPDANQRYREIIAGLEGDEFATLRKTLDRLIAHISTLEDY